MVAVHYGTSEVVDVLLRANADVNITTAEVRCQLYTLAYYRKQ